MYMRHKEFLWKSEVYFTLGLFYLRLFHADDSGMAKKNKANFRIRTKENQGH